MGTLPNESVHPLLFSASRIAHFGRTKKLSTHVTLVPNLEKFYDSPHAFLHALQIYSMCTSIVPGRIYKGGNTMSKKTDERITQDVLDELAWDPAVTLADLSVSTDHGRVRLNGIADTFGTKLEAQDAAYRVGGVTSVDNHIVVDPIDLDLRGDEDIADDITVNQPQASAVDISSGIARAFARTAELYDDNIDVTPDGGHVTLSGTVATWGEYDLATDIAWMSPGVTSVTNNIVVLFA